MRYQGTGTEGRARAASTDGVQTAALLMFSAGVICLRFLPVAPSILLSIALAVCAGIAWRWLRLPPAWTWLLPAWLAGLAWAVAVGAAVMADRLPESLEKRDLVVTGSVEGRIQHHDRGGRFDFRVQEGWLGTEPVHVPEKIRLSAYDPALLPDTATPWQLVVRLKRPRSIVNPGAAFLYETWLFQARFGATGYVVGASPNTGADGPLPFWQRRLESLRVGFAAYLSEKLSSRNAAVLAALSVGVRDDLDDADWTLLRDTGTVHLVAISGLHIGLVAGLAAFLGGWCWRRSAWLCQRLPSPLAAALVSAVAGTVYAALADFTLPTRRALLMLLVAVSAVLLSRTAAPMRLLAVVLAVVLAMDPLAPFGSSFWLSFVAVGVLVIMGLAVARQVVDAASPGIRATLVVGGWIRAQAWLFAGMAPILLLAFHQVSLVAPLANLVAVPLVGMLVVPMALIALLCWALDILAPAAWLLHVSAILLDLAWWLLDHLVALPWAVHLAAPKPAFIALALVGLATCACGPALPSRGLGLLLMVSMLLFRPAPPDPGNLDLDLLDTGQGLSVVIRTHRHVLVYDTGASWGSGYDLGEIAVLPHLRGLGVRRLDMLLLSHADNDHIGGAGAVISGLPVERILTSDTGHERAPPGSRSCYQGQAWEWDRVQFSMLWPPADAPYRGNDSSCVLLVRSESGSVLLTGDIEAPVERRLLVQYGDELAVDVLMAPHHGSKTSSSRAFLRRTRPRVALVSSGYRNRFGHPHPAVAERYHRLGIPLINTASEGAIEVRLRHDRTRLAGARDAAGFWVAQGIEDFHALNLRTSRSGERMLESAAPLPTPQFP